MPVLFLFWLQLFMKTNTYQIWPRSKVMDLQTTHQQVSVPQSLYVPIGENVVTSQSQHVPVDRAQRGSLSQMSLWAVKPVSRERLNRIKKKKRCRSGGGKT